MITTHEDLHGKTIKESFDEFDKNNPRIWRRFQALGFEAMNAGKTKTSSKMICNVIRWETYIATVKVDDYKINDSFTAHYARKFVEKYREHKNIFEFRRLRARQPDQVKADKNGQIQLL